MTWRKVATGIVILAVLHFAVMAVLFMVTFSLGMKRFDFGGEPSIVESVSDAIVSVLIFPGYQLYQAAGIQSDAFEWLTVVGNSVLWGTALLCVLIVVMQLSCRSTDAAPIS